MRGGGNVIVTIRRGDETVYAGRVGNVAAENFPEGAYAFGLFAYLETLGGQTFEVLDYWVEQR